VVGFRELRRILRDDGVVFLNYGDKYNQPATKCSRHWDGRNKKISDQSNLSIVNNIKNLPQGNLIGLAWRLALALQADGWYLRSDIIWAKALSFCDKYSGSTMPESVNGWRWERHKVKTGKLLKANFRSERSLDHQFEPNPDEKPTGNKIAQWIDCPGCEKCLPNDGLVLRKGSWRPTRAHEYLFLLTKTQNYYCDMEAVREEHAEPNRGIKKPESTNAHNAPKESMSIRWVPEEREYNPSGRNLRDVFCINPQAYPDSHYATFPEKLVEPCIKVATSEKGCCPKCGAQWARIVDTKAINRTRPKGAGVDSEIGTKGRAGELNTTNLGWFPTCKCFGSPQQVAWDVKMGILEYAPVPCIVYDPFMGSGTVAAVAARLGRNYLGSELNEDYVNNQAKYRVAEGETGITKEEQRAGQLALWSK